MNDKYFDVKGYKEAMKENKALLKAKQRKAKEETLENTGIITGKTDNNQLVTICVCNSDTLYY